MNFVNTIILIVSVISSGTCQDLDDAYNVITIDKAVFPGNERFPDNVEVHFNYYGNDIRLQLVRDDEGTSYLNEGVFHASKFLPNDVYSDDKGEHFSVYSAPENDDTVVVHRETPTAKPKFYGRYTLDDERYIINALDGSHVLHQVRREENVEPNSFGFTYDGKEFSRQKRAVSAAADDIVEVFIYADYSMFEFFRDDVTSNSLTTSELKLYMRDILKALTREVGLIYDHMRTYSSFEKIMVFMEYQIITKVSQERWLIVPGTISESTPGDLEEYFDRMRSKFAFPDADHVMQITRYPFATNELVYSFGVMCNATNRAASVVAYSENPTTLVQGLALTFNVPFDENTTCPDNNLNLMSKTYGSGSTADKQGNRWLFSQCSIDAFAAFTDNTCFQTEDAFTNVTEFLTSPLISDLFDRDGQCNLAYGGGSTFCNVDNNATLDCYSGNEGCLVNTVCEQAYFFEDTLCDTGPGPNAKCEFGFCNPNMTTTSSTSTTSTTSSTTSTTSSTTSTTSSTTSTTSSTISTTSATTSTPSPTTSKPSPTTSTTTSAPSSTTSAPSSTTSSTTTDNGQQTTTTDNKLTTTEDQDCVIKTGFVEFDLPGCGCCGGCGCDDTCDSCPNDLGRPAYAQADNCTKDPNCCGSKVRVSTFFVPDGCSAGFIPGPQTLILEKKGWEETDVDVKAEVYQDSLQNWQVELVALP